MTWSHSLCETVELIIDGRFSGGTWGMVVGGRACVRGMRVGVFDVLEILARGH